MKMDLKEIGWKVIKLIIVAMFGMIGMGV